MTKYPEYISKQLERFNDYVSNPSGDRILDSHLKRLLRISNARKLALMDLFRLILK